MRSKKLIVKHFISEPITANFSSPPNYTKKPPCPDQFNWHNETFSIQACLSERRDYSRRGRMVKNMQPQHAQVASSRGSWGVGRVYYEVQTTNKRYFRLYYDRSPKDALDREGQWILLAELTHEETEK